MTDVTHQGVFITFEGGEGAGKSSLIKAAAAALGDQHIPVTVTREPGSGRTGAAIRHAILSTEGEELDPRAEALLFAADRAQNVATVIRPALERGEVVLCDRHVDSSVAYQGVGRGLGPEQIRSISSWATQELVPDLTIIVDISPEEGLRRKHDQKETNRMEEMDLEFHHQVRVAFNNLASEDERRIRVIDGHQPFDYVLADVIGLVMFAWSNKQAAPEHEDLIS